ncbi:MAG: 2-amino-4-hydroxy-6-hydroxymethyldihydropteridine diphosphokinase [Bacteroidales bacterium]|nr:2-amino-4-hydroxy-6-hydroxymethyldihydropteridine diphosphokinase [Bacteroidales bacterium]MBR6310809.1 2-amino-4-hydroxy-6-hydroxymethyldihydropteridine diphosphokinase [Paludibacteraceae bacterium]
MKIYLGLGSNLGNKRLNILRAIEMINEEIGTVSVSSSFFESKPWHFSSDEMFINAVVEANTQLSPEELLDACKDIEKKMGRVKTKENEYEDRLIDLDILFYGNQTVNTERLTIPHETIEERDFVIIPMAEIAPDFVHPVLGKSIKALADSLQISAINPDNR